MQEVSLNYTPYTPLHGTAQYGQLDAAKLLLEKGVEEDNVRDRFYDTPLHWAARNGHQATAELLRKNA